MTTKKEEVIQTVSNWSPDLFIQLVSEIAWPIVILILGWNFRGGITNTISNFFKKNNVTEVSASTSGITAKFKAAQQKAETNEENATSNTTAPIDGDYDSVVEKHNQQITEYSDELFDSIKVQVKALGTSDATKIDLLTKEISILQAALRFNSINLVLFRSQFDLFNIMPEDGSIISNQDLQTYFNDVTSANHSNYEGWDLVKYLSYPVSIGLIGYKNNGYHITKLGKSYLQYMRKNISSIDNLAKM